MTRRGLAYTTLDARPPWHGDGRPVVFHHGIGTNRDIWCGWLPEVAAQHRVVRFDFRGFGASAVPPADHTWTIRELIDDVLDVADIAGPEPVHIVGESMGGTIALAAAIERPDRFASVTISNAGYKGQGIGRLPGWKAEIEMDGIAAWAERMMPLRFAPGAADARRLAWFAAEQARAKPHVVLGLGDLLARLDLTEQAPSLKIPLLILAPDSSPFVPVRQATELVELIPHAELNVFAGVRHGLPFSHAAEASRITRDFLARVERGEAGRARLS
ncbi:MAG: alpha/beta fold hydrolase [Hyphomicrobiaceae bacterium]